MDNKELLDLVQVRVVGFEESQFPSGMDRGNISVRNELREYQSKELKKLYKIISKK